MHRLCVEDILVALTEAAANAALHSGAGVAEVRLEVLDDHVRLTIADQGRGFDVARVDPSRRPSLTSHGGRGFYLIWCVMYSVELEGVNGTTITMTKYLRPDDCFRRGSGEPPPQG